ncbi:MAG: YnbE family lipoprotein [Verrucomicrobiota bacterium]
MKTHQPTFFLLAALLLGGCIKVQTEHRIEPIEINLNVRVQVDRELDNFFSDLDNQNPTIQ